MIIIIITIEIIIIFDLINRTRLTPKSRSYASSWHGRCMATCLQFHFRTGTNQLRIIYSDLISMVVHVHQIGKV
jgi:hypothetical protein